MKNRVSPVTAAGKLTNRRSPNPQLRSRTLAPLLALLVLSGLAFSATPAQAEFGIQRAAISARTQAGTPDVQAGSHPYSLTTSLIFNEPTRPDSLEGNVKDVTVELPPGLVGNPTATPRCSYAEFLAGEAGKGCPNDTVVGIATTTVTTAEEHEYAFGSDPVYNLVPAPGEAAQFGYLAAGLVPVLLGSTVRDGSDYGVTTSAPDIGETAEIGSSKVTLWGVPADSSHDPWRGSCLRPLLAGPNPNIEYPGQGLDGSEAEEEGPLYRQGEESPFGGAPESKGECPSDAPPKPLLTMPRSCGRPLSGSISVDSWEEQGKFHTAKLELPELQGCEKLPFSTKLGVTPETTAGSTPTGLDFEAQQPQEGLESPEGLAESDLKEYSVPLPEGLQLNGSAVNGLATCSLAEIGYRGMAELDPSSEPGVLTPQFTPEKPSCPNASKIGNVRIKTPLLEGELEGGVYVAAPQNYKAGPLENPFGSLTAAYGVAEEPKTGVMVKLPANILRNPETGALTFTLKQSPQLPYSVAKIELFGGERAVLATGPRCGAFTAEGTFSPWSGTSPFVSLSSFDITSGPGGSPCPGGVLPFSPSLQTGTSSINAGAFSPLTTVIHRADGQQAIHNVTISYPPGVSAVLTGVPECGEAQANAGTCGAESLIGEDTASVGLGNDPYTVTGGEVYLTGPYDGAPFGLSIVTPAKAGPFVLDEGAPVVTRAKLEINPTTAQVTVVTGEIPRILDGIPLQVKQITVNVNRANFAINPTSCDRMGVSGSIGGWEGSSFPVADPLQVGDCQNLKFTPKFSVSTAGHTSKALGASLTTKITEPAGALGSQANIARVKVDLPIQLPSQLKTLHMACLSKTFEEGFEKCLKESPDAKVGEAIVHTPLLPVPLTGPAIFVSHGNEAFPSLTMVLQGDGVTIDLVGATFIHGGITSTTFKTVPDVPFTTFELTLPQSKFSALTSNLPEKDKGNLCGQNLKMPTEFLAQNGTKINEDTSIGISGCAKVKALTNKEKLAKALKTCRKDKSKTKKAKCEKAAKKKYPVAKAKKKGKAGKK